MNYLEHLRTEGLLEKHFQNGMRDAAIEASKKTANAMENNSPQPLSPADGPAESPSGSDDMTPAKAEQRMTALRNKLEAGGQWTDAEVGEAKEVLMFLEGSKAN